MSKKKDCRFCEQGWTPCEEHGHSSMCNKYLNGHYKEIVFEQDEEIPTGAWESKPTPQPTGSLRAVLDRLLTLGEMYTPEDLNEALAQLEELMLEVIGGYETTNFFKSSPQEAYIRDTLRQEQRERLKQHLIKEK